MPSVALTGPYCSTMRSRAIISDSAMITGLQLWPRLFSAVETIMKPLPSSSSFITFGALPDLRSVPHEPPCVKTMRLFQPACGRHGFHDFSGSKSVAIRYWSRSW